MIKELAYISMFSVLIPIFMGIFQLKRIPNYLILIFILISISCISDFATWQYPESRIIIWPLYITTQYIILILVFITVIDVRSIKNVLYGVLASLFIYTLIYHIYLKNADTHYPDLRLIQSFVFIFLSLYYYYYILTRMPTLELFTYPLFWINTAIFLYFAGNIFLQGAINSFTMEKVYHLYIPIHNVLNTIKNILFGIAFYMQYKIAKQGKLT